MTTQFLSIAFTVLKFILDRVSASNATKEAFQKLVEATVNDGLISKDSHNVFSDQFHEIEAALNAKSKTSDERPPKSK